MQGNFQGGKDMKKTKLSLKSSLGNEVSKTKTAMFAKAASKPTLKSTTVKTKMSGPSDTGSKAIAKTSLQEKLDEVSSGREKRASRRSANLGAAELTAVQLKELEQRLRRLREEFKISLTEKADYFNISSMNESLIKGDDAEVAEKQRVNNAALQELEFLKTRLQLVQRALYKINLGVYGICEETEEPIGYERLNIVPWAKFAVHIQEVRERKLREYRGSKTRAEL